MSAEMAAFCHQCGKPLTADDTFCTDCGAKRLDIAGSGEACARCGAPVKPGDAFCMGCGAPKGASASPARAPGPPAAVAAAQRVASMSGAIAGGGGIALPWQTITTGQPIDAAGLAKAAAPSLLAIAPHPAASSDLGPSR